jgi:hypothetical protein
VAPARTSGENPSSEEGSVHAGGVRCFAFATPACADVSLCRLAWEGGNITTVVNQDDIVPRASLHNVTAAIQQLQAYDQWHEHAKEDWEAVQSRVCSYLYSTLIHSHTVPTHCIQTLHSYITPTHCTHTLHSYTALIHCTHTLHSYITLIHYTHTLHSYTIHCALGKQCNPDWGTTQHTLYTHAAYTVALCCTYIPILHSYSLLILHSGN